MVFDPDSFQFLEVNEAAVKLYGYSNEEFTGLTIGDLHPKDEKNLLTEILPGIKAFKNSDVWRHIKKDGSTIYVDFCVYSITHEEKELRLVITCDVSEHFRKNDEFVSNERYCLFR